MKFLMFLLLDAILLEVMKNDYYTFCAFIMTDKLASNIAS